MNRISRYLRISAIFSIVISTFLIAEAARPRLKAADLINQSQIIVVAEFINVVHGELSDHGDYNELGYFETKEIIKGEISDQYKVLGGSKYQVRPPPVSMQIMEKGEYLVFLNKYGDDQGDIYQTATGGNDSFIKVTDGNTIWNSMLSSPEQSIRDRAAEKIRTGTTLPDKDAWTKKLASVRTNMTMKKLENQLEKAGVERVNAEAVVCSGLVRASCSGNYRLDDFFILAVRYTDRLRSFEIREAPVHLPVKFPEVYTGKWVTYYANGNKSSEAVYKNGQVVGETIYFDHKGGVLK